MTDEALSQLAQNGPWAIAAAFLLWQVIKAWNSDREQLVRLLAEFKGTLDHLSQAVQSLSDKMDERQ